MLNRDSIHSFLNRYFPDICIAGLHQSPYEHVWILHTGQEQEFVVKLHNPSVRNNLSSLETIYTVLSKERICPHFLRSKYDQCLTLFENHYVSVQKNVPASSDIESVPPSMLAEKIALMHKTLGSIPGLQITNHLFKPFEKMKDLAERYGYQDYIHEIKTVQQIVTNSATQTIHGDLHKANFLVRGNDIYILDFDSATEFPPVSDTVFSAFRIFRNHPEKIRTFFNTYEQYAGYENNSIAELARPFIIYNILQRILFILDENDKGNREFLYDLENQQSYLARAVSDWV